MPIIRRPRWKPSDVSRLRALRAIGWSRKAIARRLGRTPDAVRSMLARITPTHAELASGIRDLPDRRTRRGATAATTPTLTPDF